MMHRVRQGSLLQLSAQQQCCFESLPQLMRRRIQQQCYQKSVKYAVSSNHQVTDSSDNNEANISSTTGQQVKPQAPVKDRLDTGRRAKGKAKIPFPRLPDTSQPGSTESPVDADSPGFQERALLAGFLETLDPETQQQFAQYMESQLQQVQETQQQGSAVDFLQAALGKAAHRSLRSTRDVRGYFEGSKADAVMWDTLRDQFSKEEVAVLDHVFGSDWSSFSGRALNPDTVNRISMLTVEQQAVLSNVLSKISCMTDQLETVEAGVQSVTENDNGSNSADDNSSRPGQTVSTSRWGASFRRRKADRLSKSSSSSSTNTGSAGAAAAAGIDGPGPQQYWDTLLDQGMSDKVQRMMALAGQASRGQLQWGRPPSSHFTQLQQVYAKMAQLEAIQLQQPEQLSPSAVAAAYASINDQLNALVAQADSIQDTATRSALLYMDALFNSSSDADNPGSSSSSGGGSGGSSKVHGDLPGPKESAAVESHSTSNSSADGLQQQQHEAVHTEAAAAAAGGMVTLRKLDKLGKFLKAAGNLEAYQSLLIVVAEKHPNLASQEMLWLSNLGGDDWFVKPEQQDQALAAAQAAAEALAAVEAAAAAAAAPGRSSMRSKTSAISGALLPYVDESRIAALAVLDADTLWFMAELEANDNSDDVIMKWSLHPVVGQKMLSGSWLAESSMPEPLRQLYQQVKVPDFMSVLNSNF